MTEDLETELDDDVECQQCRGEVPKLMEAMWAAAVDFYGGRLGGDQQERVLMALANIAGSVLALPGFTEESAEGFIEVLRTVQEDPTMEFTKAQRSDN